MCIDNDELDDRHGHTQTQRKFSTGKKQSRTKKCRAFLTDLWDLCQQCTWDNRKLLDVVDDDDEDTPKTPRIEFYGWFYKRIMVHTIPLIDQNKLKFQNGTQLNSFHSLGIMCMVRWWDIFLTILCSVYVYLSWA